MQVKDVKYCRAGMPPGQGRLRRSHKPEPSRNECKTAGAAVYAGVRYLNSKEVRSALEIITASSEHDNRCSQKQQLNNKAN